MCVTPEVRGATLFGGCRNSMRRWRESPSGAIAITFRKDPQARQLLLRLANKPETRLRFPPVPMRPSAKGSLEHRRPHFWVRHDYCDLRPCIPLAPETYSHCGSQLNAAHISTTTPTTILPPFLVLMAVSQGHVLLTSASSSQLQVHRKCTPGHPARY